jgi:hypothetical protein
MPTGHHFTRCQYCNREYVCGDCITTNCELGHDKKSCEYYKAHLAQTRASAILLKKMSKDNPTGKSRAGAILLADHAWSELASELSNNELADALIEKVWAAFETGTEEGNLVMEAIERLKNRKPTDGMQRGGACAPREGGV